MNETKTGGPAFPQPDMIDDGQLVAQGHTGMTLRDYFAAKALQGIYSHTGGVSPNWAECDDDVAITCYEMADAMLKARNQ